MPALTSQTIIPKEVHALFIIMENDYFQSVNTPQKVTKLIEKYKEKDAKTNIVFLKNHYHMPNLNKELVYLLYYSYLFLTNNMYISYLELLIYLFNCSTSIILRIASVP